MKVNEYDIDSLVNTFSEHARKQDLWNLEHPENSIDDDFCICKALASIVKEIKLIKDKYESK